MAAHLHYYLELFLKLDLQPAHRMYFLSLLTMAYSFHHLSAHAHVGFNFDDIRHAMFGISIVGLNNSLLDCENRHSLSLESWHAWNLCWQNAY